MNMSFLDDFIAQDSQLARELNTEETNIVSSFPNININNISFLGMGAIRPSESNCKKYECLYAPVLVYNKTSGELAGSFTINNGDVTLSQMIWDKCHSADYKCIYHGHFGATYNCIGWALGVSKWLDPNEINAYIESGYTRGVAIKKFMEDKLSLYQNDNISNFDKILGIHDTFSPSLEQNPIVNNTLAFHFKDNLCTHGARYLTTIKGEQLNKWTSKLGSSILISHEQLDLTGTESIYGSELHYGMAGENNNENAFKDEL
jgi:hypothetical protein